jgi:hypothetical protein
MAASAAGRRDMWPLGTMMRRHGSSSVIVRVSESKGPGERRRHGTVVAGETPAAVVTAQE